MPLIRHVLQSLAKSVLITLGLTAAAPAKDAAIHKKFFWSGVALIISNEEKNDILKIAKSLEESGLLIKGISKTSKNEVKEQKGEFLSILLSGLGASLLGNIFTGKGTITSGEGTIRADQDF